MLLIADGNMYNVAWLIINNVFVEDQITWQRNILTHAYGSQLFAVSFPQFVWFSLTSMIKFAYLNTPYLIKNKSKQWLSVFNSWWMLLGFPKLRNLQSLTSALCVPCRKKHKKKVDDSESWPRQEESEKNLRSSETPRLNTRQLR